MKQQETTEQEQEHSPTEAIRHAVQSDRPGRYSLPPAGLESLSEDEVCAGSLSFNELTKLVHAAPNGCLEGRVIQGETTKWLAQEIQYDNESTGLAESEIEGPIELVEMLLFIIENYPQPDHFSEQMRANHCFFNAALIAGFADSQMFFSNARIQKGVVLDAELQADGTRPDHCIASFCYKGECYYAEIYPFVGVGPRSRSDALRLLKTEPEPPYGFGRSQTFTVDAIRSRNLDNLRPSRADEVHEAYESGSRFEASPLPLLSENA